MAFPPNWTKVPVTGRFIEIDGDPVAGYIQFTPTPTRMIDVALLTTVLRAPITVQLKADGSFKTRLPATDDPDITPVDFTYEVKEMFQNGGGATYNIEVPMLYVNSGIDLSAVAPVSANPGLPPTITEEDFAALAMQVEMLLGTVYGGSAQTQFAGPGLDGGSAAGV